MSQAADRSGADLPMGGVADGISLVVVKSYVTAVRSCRASQAPLRASPLLVLFYACCTSDICGDVTASARS